MRKTLALLTAITAAGCSFAGSGNAVAPPAPVSYAALPSPGKYIKHVVIVIQENRTLENVFAGYPGADAPMFGRTSDGKRVPLHQITFHAYDFSHSWRTALQDYNHGKMNGFNLNLSIPKSGPLAAYAYLDRTQVAPYWAMAQQYVLADAMFPTQFGPSFTAHLDLIASTAKLAPNLAEVNSPTSASSWGCDAPAGTTTQTVSAKRKVSSNGPFPCFNQFASLANTLDASYTSWRFYAPRLRAEGGIWSTFSSIRRVRYGKDWKYVISPQTKVLEDAKAGNLPAVTWVVPDAKDSDHPAVGSDTGPSWVASVVNAVGRGQDWKTSAIVVVWDDWGGWYDNAKPPQRDYLGLGIRVPCVIISPYVHAGYVSHTQYEFGSILRFVEDTFGLPALGPPSTYTDRRGNSIVDAFDFTQKPRAFAPIPAKYPADYFIDRPPSGLPPDND
ncbi:MAG TPA: alkaline phosphatase family protein [Candidatus Baltobacteraceae bacterium]|nr:alkaline phosphatase family protein [Candidatus Baltobacteraceae bacterium]